MLDPPDTSPAPSSFLRRAVGGGRRLARRSGMLTVGWLLLGLGLMLMPTPLPLGLILFLAGLAVLARESELTRRAIRWVRRRLPGLSAALNRAKPRLPNSLRVFVESTDPVSAPLPEGVAGE